MTGVDGGQLAVMLCEGLMVDDVRVVYAVPAGSTPVPVLLDTGNQL